MSRRKTAASLNKPKVPDHFYGSTQVSQLINMIMSDGKKQLATRIVYKAFDGLYEYYLKELDGKTTMQVTSQSGKDADDTNSESEIAFADMDKRDAVLRIFEDILERVGPSLELVSKRVGGANIQVPIVVRPNRKSTLAMRFIIKNAQGRKKAMKSMIASLKQELVDVLKGTAKSLDDKENTLRMAKANAVFQGVRR